MSINEFINDPINDTVTITSGKIKGRLCNNKDTVAWLGIPYAKPPIGKRRWKAPSEVTPWAGVLEVQQYKSPSVQGAQEAAIGNEDCLYLNVWRPNSAKTNLPVFVFLHGGGNIAGSGQDFSGEQLASATDSIIITLNYRLGAMGFFRHPALKTENPIDDSGNFAILDIIFALKWVQANISSFGGNPSNVTLAGQSAGARNALAISISPLASGLFHKLYVMSGGLTTSTIEQGETKANQVLAALLIKDKIVPNDEEAYRWIRSQSSATISKYLYEQDASAFAAAIGETELRMGAFPHLFEDGFVIPTGGFELLKQQKLPAMPIVAGSTGSEFSFFTLMNPRFSAMTDIQAQPPQQQPFQEELLQLYKAAVQYGSELYAAFNAEQVAMRFMQSNPQASIYAYRFCWGMHHNVVDPNLAVLIGAHHGADLAFYTGDFAQQNTPPGMYAEYNEQGRMRLSSIMRSYLKNFLHDGNPNGSVLSSVFSDELGNKPSDEPRDKPSNEPRDEPRNAAGDERSDMLPQWPSWTTQFKGQNILCLDADAAQPIVQSIDKLDKTDILARMHEDNSLSAEQLDWLKSHLFAGRFFWK